MRVIHITAPLIDVLQQISACELVVSNSLHGIVFAHA